MGSAPVFASAAQALDMARVSLWGRRTHAGSLTS